MDTNPFANNQQAQAVGQSSYLQQTPNPTGVMGNIANIVKALVAGNQQYQQQQRMKQQQVTGQPQMGGASQTQPSPPQPGGGIGGPAGVYSMPAQINQMNNPVLSGQNNPVASALFSQIPGN